jgi:hypothetical protein
MYDRAGSNREGAKDAKTDAKEREKAGGQVTKAGKEGGFESTSDCLCGCHCVSAAVLLFPVSHSLRVGLRDLRGLAAAVRGIREAPEIQCAATAKATA